MAIVAPLLYIAPLKIHKKYLLHHCTYILHTSRTTRLHIREITIRDIQFPTRPCNKQSSTSATIRRDILKHITEKRYTIRRIPNENNRSTHRINILKSVIFKPPNPIRPTAQGTRHPDSRARAPPSQLA
jgi:hypothetical protein